MGRTKPGALATVRTAPGRPAVHSPIASITPIPCPATQRNGAPNPSGSSRAPSARNGMMTKSDRGAVARLATSPYMAERLKCCRANGPVAAPATRLAITAIPSQVPARCTNRIGHGAEISRGRTGQASTSATSAAVAANDIWKPGVTMASGWNSRTTKAATASACMVMAWRSSNTARNAIEAVIAARSAGGGCPDTTR